jgi:hypothetical protein
VEILHPSPDNNVQEKRLDGEAEALWFSVSQTENGELELEETARFGNLISEYLEHIKSASSPSSSYPRLASFIGNTGAGKSSLIHLLMKHPWDSSTSTIERQRLQNMPFPVVGQPESTIPTSGDVHLYCDPLPNTDKSQQSNPLLYADCEDSMAATSSQQAIDPERRQARALTIADCMYLLKDGTSRYAAE